MRDFLQGLLKSYDGKEAMIIGSRAAQYALEHFIKGVPFKEAVTMHWAWQP